MTEKSSSSNASVNAKMGLAGWLTLLFVILKLNPGEHLTSPVVDWSWWLVFSPIIIAWAIVLVILLCIGAVFLVAFVHDEWTRRKRKKEQKATQHMTPAERREYFANKRKR